MQTQMSSRPQKKNGRTASSFGNNAGRSRAAQLVLQLRLLTRRALPPYAVGFTRPKPDTSCAGLRPQTLELKKEGLE